MEPRLIQLTHANLNNTIEVATDLLFTWYWSPGHHATHLLSSGGAIIPVKESVQVVREKYLTARLSQNQPSINRVSTDTEREPVNGI